MEELHERIDSGACRVIAVIGAGGKTTVCRALTRGLPGKNIYTTTTHMLRPNDLFCLDQRDAGEIAAALCTHGHIALCGACAENNRDKVGAPSKAAYAEACKLADHVIVEADGARGRLLKVHDAHEPVIPDNADLVLCVASCLSLGQPLMNAVHRPERIADFFHKRPEDPVTEADIALALAAPKKGDGRYLAVLNRADHAAAAARIGKLLFEGYGIGSVCIASFGGGSGFGDADLGGDGLDRVFAGLLESAEHGHEHDGDEPARKAPVV